MPRLDAKTVGKLDTNFDYIKYGKDDEDDEYNDNFEDINNDDQIIDNMKDRGSLKMIDHQNNN